MLELIAQGKNLDHRWRRPLPTGEVIELGRVTSTFRVPWDSQISRTHVRLSGGADNVRVTKLATAANPVFFQGKELAEFVLRPGDHFVIGNTTFTLTNALAQATLDLPQPVRQRIFSPEFLRQVRFRDAEQRIDVLSRLPDLISSAGNQQELLSRLVNTLMAGIPSATAIGIVRCDPNSPKLGTESPSDRKLSNAPSPSQEVSIIHWDCRSESAKGFQPSEKLIRQSFEVRETVLHIWQSAGEAGQIFTMASDSDWAFACPISSQATEGWVIYVTGSLNQNLASGDSRLSDADDRQGDIKFCELVGSTLKNLLTVNQLQRRQASLRSFFSPLVMEVVAGGDPDEVLAPKECLVSVMFCDLRGFSRTSESMSHELFGLLDRVSKSLDVVTGQILGHGGVIGDFHGDSAMGFWGWPLPQADIAYRALNTALEIKAEFEEQRNSESQPWYGADSHSVPLEQLPVGIGIATGVVVAGKIGTSDQVKVTAFGPVVNLASRLEGMNRLLNSAILLDRATVDQYRNHLLLSGKPELNSGDEIHADSSLSTGQMMVRTLGKFLPYGMSSEIEVFQLLGHDQSIDDSEIEEFEAAIASLASGAWATAAVYFASIEATDSVARFFAEYIRSFGGIAPEKWNGVIEMQSK